MITGRPIGVFLIVGFFVSSVDFFFGSVCFSVLHSCVVLRWLVLGVLVLGGNSGTTMGDLVPRWLCVESDFRVGSFPGCLGVFGFFLVFSDVVAPLFPVDSFLNEFHSSVEVMLIRIVVRYLDRVELQ